MWKNNAQAYIALLQRTIQKTRIEIHLKDMKDKFTYIDLGLPSGRLWASENAEGYYTYDEAKEKFGEMLPKPKSFQELWEECQWLWDVKKKGMLVIGPNKNTIFLPVLGYGGSEGFNNRYSYGYYCSSDIRKDTPIVLNFNAEAVWPESNFHYSCGLSVRLCREV